MSMKAIVKMDPIEKIALKRALGNNGVAQKKFTSEVHRMSEPYTPLGFHESTSIEDKQIAYRGLDVKEQWNNAAGDGLRGKQWCMRMWADRGPEIVKKIAGIVGGKAK